MFDPRSNSPTVRRFDWTTGAAMAAGEFLEDARRRGGFDESTWRRILWHGGLFVDRRRFRAESHATVPAGSRTDRRLRLRGQGLRRRDGTRGDHYVMIKVDVPGRISPEERKLYEKLSKISEFDPRRSRSRR